MVNESSSKEKVQSLRNNDLRPLAEYALCDHKYNIEIKQEVHTNIVKAIDSTEQANGNM
jgi:hypothetical protein